MIEFIFNKKRKLILNNQLMIEDISADRNYYRHKLWMINIYKILRIFIWIICISFIVG